MILHCLEVLQQYFLTKQNVLGILVVKKIHSLTSSTKISNYYSVCANDKNF